MSLHTDSMRASDIAWWAAIASAVGFVIGVATFPLIDGTSCAAMGFAGVGCERGYGLWDVTSSLGMLVFFLGVPTAAGSWLYARLTTP